MPLFSRSHAEPAQQPAPQPEPQPVYEEQPKKRGLFGSRHHTPPQAGPNGTYNNNTANGAYSNGAYNGRGGSAGTSPERNGTVGHNGGGGGGIFRRSTDATSINSSQRGGGGSLLHRSFGNGNHDELDPSIVQARERVMGAEAAEREADRALLAARESVREAREHVRRLELEAQEEARRAKIKQQQAKEVSKRGKALGRYDY